MIAFITDSTCDIPQELIEQYDISVVPMTVVWSGKQYRDRVELPPEEFYRRLPIEREKPTSATPAPADFEAAYADALAKGATAIVVLTISSAMSGTYQLALKTAPQGNVPVVVIDSKGPTMTLGWQVLAAARAREAGAGLPEILRATDTVRTNLMQLVAMDTLEYLQRGGRIGRAVAWMGVRLQVRPVVWINHETGLVEPVGLARTHKGAIEMMWSKFAAHMRDRREAHVAVLHGNAPDEAAALAERVRRELHPEEIIVNMTGPVLGINTGPGALALCGYGEKVGS